jgi:hypothetical protein
VAAHAPEGRPMDIRMARVIAERRCMTVLLNQAGRLSKLF